MLGLPPGLIAAVVDAPQDDAPRLVCADWLDEQGDTEAGEYVRLGVRIFGIRGYGPDAAEWEAARARLAELEAATSPRRFAPLVEACGATGFMCTSVRGFPSWLRLTCPLTPSVLRAAACFPTVYRLVHLGGEGEGEAGDATFADLAALVPMRGLEYLTLRLTGELLWEHLEPLVALPRLAEVVLPGPGGDLLRGPLRRRWTVARSRAAAERPAADAVAAARGLFGTRSVSVADSGDAAIHAGRLQPGRVAAIAAVPRLRALDVVTGDLPAGLFRLPELRALRLSLTATPKLRPADWAPLAGLRELRLDWHASGDGWRELPACLAHTPRLRAMVLDGTGGPGPAEIPASLDLRVLGTSRLGTRDQFAALGWPGLVEWSAPARSPTWHALEVSRFPKLRLVRFGKQRGVARDLTRPDRALAASVTLDEAVAQALAAGAVRHTCDGVSLAVPEWFAPEPTPAGDARTPEVVPLAAWREWGDRDDDFGTFAPTRIRLERIDEDVPDADVPAALAGPPTPLPRTGVLAIQTPPGYAATLIRCRFGRVDAASVRALWRMPGRAYRLVCDGSPGRAIGPAAVAAFVADSLDVAGGA